MQYAACLTGGPFDEARMLQNIEACEWLTGALRGLEVPNLDSSYANLRAVCPFCTASLSYFSDLNVFREIFMGNYMVCMHVTP